MQRVVTAVVLGTLIVAAVVMLPTGWLAAILGGIVAVAAWEWCTLARIKNSVLRVCYTVTIAALMVVLYDFGRVQTTQLLILAFAWWCLAWCWIFAAQRRAIDVVTLAPLNTALLGLLILPAAWVAVVELHRLGDSGASAVLLLMLVIWGADIAAFFGGRRWGRTPLASKLSPGKTWEGVMTALVATLLTALVGLQAFDVGLRALPLVVLCLVTAVFSVLGDLFESLLKRLAGVKDSGKLLPGHGGVLDRVDSMTAAAPVFALGVITMRSGG